MNEIAAIAAYYAALRRFSVTSGVGSASFVARTQRGAVMQQPIVIHTDEDYEHAQQRVAELQAASDSHAKEQELQALAEAMLAWEMRRETAEE